jgi:hypothetical protein
MLNKLRRWLHRTKHFDERLVQRTPEGRFSPVQLLPVPCADQVTVDSTAGSQEENTPPPLLRIPFRPGFEARPLGERHTVDWLRRE